jgi:putative ABC transport system permease protein
LGTGAVTAIVTAVTPVLFEPLPYPNPERLVCIVETSPSDASRIPGTFGMFAHLAERTRSFDAMAVLRSWEPTLTGVEPPERLDGRRVSADYFRVLGVPPARGRDFQVEDDRAGGPNVVVLSDTLWHRRFGGDPSLIGRTVRLDEMAYAVVGSCRRDSRTCSRRQQTSGPRSNTTCPRDARGGIIFRRSAGCPAGPASMRQPATYMPPGVRCCSS